MLDESLTKRFRQSHVRNFVDSHLTGYAARAVILFVYANADEKHDLDELARQLKLDPRAIKQVVDNLLSLHFLEPDKTGKFALSADRRTRQVLSDFVRALEDINFRRRLDAHLLALEPHSTPASNVLAVRAKMLF